MQIRLHKDNIAICGNRGSYSKGFAAGVRVAWNGSFPFVEEG
jgi:hypothetical protein